MRTVLVTLLATASVLGCSASTARLTSPDAATCDAHLECDSDRACDRNTQCLWYEACVHGTCAESTTCDGVTTNGEVICLGQDDVGLLDGTSPRYPWLHLLVDGGAPSLGTGADFRCPAVSELRLNVGGESVGAQPICGPNPALSPRTDAEIDAPCCYGTIVVATP